MRHVRRLAVVIFTIEAVFSLSLSCSSISPAPQMSGPVGLVRFPDPWVKQIGNSTRGVNDNIHFVLRKTASGELLFAVKQGFDASVYGQEVYDFPVTSPQYDYYSDNKFSLNLDGAFRVRNATDQEWYGAEKVLHSYHFISSFNNKQVTSEGVEYKGRLFRKSGESWGNEAALVSPRETWIAVFSFSSREKPNPGIIPGLGSKEPGYGEVFLDLYDTSNAARIIAVRSVFGKKGGGGFAPSMLFGESVWIEDRYFIMPLNWWLEECFVGALPQK